MTTTRILTLTAEERAHLMNGDHYEQFYAEASTDMSNMDAINAGLILDPARPGIVAEYVTHGYGYLIQKTEDGFRFIAVEAGEEDDFGPTLATKLEATIAARKNWHSYDGKDSDYRWSQELAKDADIPERVEVDAIASIIGAEAAAKLTDEEIARIAQQIADHVNGL